MSLLIRNARILTLSAGPRLRRGREMSELGVIAQGDVLVSEGRIAAVGPKVDAPAGTESIDAKGRVLMPGFIDCHTHACWAGTGIDDWEARLKGSSEADIVKKGGGAPARVRAVGEATKKQLAAWLRERLARLLAQGTTTVEVKSGFGTTVEAELKVLRAIVRAGQDWSGTLVTTAFLGRVTEGGAEEHARMVVKEMLPEIARELPGITIDLGGDTAGWSKEACLRLLEKAAKHHPLRVHAEAASWPGMIPEAVRLHARSVDHLEAATKADLEILAGSGTCAVIVPVTGFQAGGRFARAGFTIDQGGAVALATHADGASAPTLSMALAVALAVRHCGLTPQEAITACTANAAAVLGLQDRGTIEVGRRADLLLLEHTDERQLAFEVGGDPVDLVLCAGAAVKAAQAEAPAAARP